MGEFYQKFLRTEIDLAPLGVERREEDTPYFCTPKGASILGWAGVDGIHYCFIHGFGEMVFAVSPENSAPDYVHPLAENFEDFLRLLLACGDANFLEQAWMWDRDKFQACCAAYQPTEEAEAVLDRIADTMQIVPMEDPWQYLKQVEASFDSDKIRYTEDFYNFSMTPNGAGKRQKWAVYFGENMYSIHGKGRAGKEIPIHGAFTFAEHQWVIPAVYTFREGLTIDFCMRVDPQKCMQYLQKWQAGSSGEDWCRKEQMQLEADNPLNLEICPEVFVNGEKLRSEGSSGGGFVPIQEPNANRQEVLHMMEHYHLDPAYAWSFRRMHFLWAGKQPPEMNSLELTMIQEPVSIPGENFSVSKSGDRVQLKMPGNQGVCTLTVQTYEPLVMDYTDVFRDGMDYPPCYTRMGYTLTPDLPSECFTICDCAENDPPRPKQKENPEPVEGSCEADAIMMIGGADGPTAVFLGGSAQKKGQHAACSSPHFAPAEQIEWYPVFTGTEYEPVKVTLL